MGRLRLRYDGSVFVGCCSCESCSCRTICLLQPSLRIHGQAIVAAPPRKAFFSKGRDVSAVEGSAHCSHQHPSTTSTRPCSSARRYGLSLSCALNRSSSAMAAGMHHRPSGGFCESCESLSPPPRAPPSRVASSQRSVYLGQG